MDSRSTGDELHGPNPTDSSTGTFSRANDLWDESDTPGRSAADEARRILSEMQALDSWGSSNNEQYEHQLLHQLRECVLEESRLQELEALPKRMCAYEFKPGDIAWNCKVCQVDETCVMCNDCFISSDHEGHEVFFYYTHSGGCCDCGDPEAWAPEGFCTRHKGAQDVDPLVFFPQDLLVTARDCLNQVVPMVASVLHEARSIPVMTDDDATYASERLDAAGIGYRFSVIAHFNELQTSQEFASTINTAHSTIQYQLLKIVNDMTAHKQSVVRADGANEEVTELVQALHKNGIITSIVSTGYKNKIPLVNSLLHWLASLANLSDGLCRLICEELVTSSTDKNEVESDDGGSTPMEIDTDPSEDASHNLQALILADAFLPKSTSDSLHSLLMALLADPWFKKTFAVAFTWSYQQLYREFASGLGSSSLTILTFGVQFFNRASFVRLLVDEHELLEVLMSSVLETLRCRAKRLTVDPSATDRCMGLLFQPGHRTHIWDIFALGVARSTSLYMNGVDLQALRHEAEKSGLQVRNADDPCFFLRLPHDTKLPGRHELDVTSPVFVYRRYMSGLLDLRYALQIDGVSESFVLERHGARFSEFLLYLTYIQGVCAETRQRGQHVELESRGWVVTVEFVSTASDVFTWIIANVFKGLESDATRNRLEQLVPNITQPILDALYLWLSTSDKYFPPADYTLGSTVLPHHIDTAVSCHYPVHRTLSQLVRTLCTTSHGFNLLCTLLGGSYGSRQDVQELWTHPKQTPIGFWHRIQLVQPVLQAIVWDAQVHAGLWVRNGMSVVNHSMNYGEPPFCARFRDLDLLLLQFGVQLLGIDWVVTSILQQFGVADWLHPNSYSSESENEDKQSSAMMVTECLSLLSQLASELPPKIATDDILKSMYPYLRREVVQRLCVGPCAHSDLSKIVTEFFLTHESLIGSNFSGEPVLDQVLKEVCVQSSASGEPNMGQSVDRPSGGRFMYVLKPELFAEYNPTFIHLTRKQHEQAHENWFLHRVRASKRREQNEEDGAPNATHSSWLDFPLVNMFLPCTGGFRSTRTAILHEGARRVVYEACSRAVHDANASLSVLSRAIHLFTLQLYVVEELQYISSCEEQDAAVQEGMELRESYLQWLTQVPDQGASVVQLLLRLNPWSPSGGDSQTVLDGDQKHEIGRGIDWLLHRAARLSPACDQLVKDYWSNQRASEDDQARKQAMLKRRKDAQMRALQQMQQRQAAFAAQMEKMAGEEEAHEEEDADLEATAEKVERQSQSEVEEEEADVDMRVEEVAERPECAMCHSFESSDSFMCYVGFAQCSPVCSRVNGGNSFSSPLDEMHRGQDVPVYLRLCGHSVHQSCWEAYHASQFQRAITGGHHRLALNTVDVTKKEFLCPLCKSISNVLVPSATEALEDILPCVRRSEKNVTQASPSDMMQWLTDVVRVDSIDDRSVKERDGETMDMDDLEEKPPAELSSSAETLAVAAGPGGVEELGQWLDYGLSALCMSIHKVACGAMQKSRPDRYTSSASTALFHTLLCSFLSAEDGSGQMQVKLEQQFLQSMRFLPIMLQQQSGPGIKVTPATVQRDVAHLLYFGGSNLLDDGSVVLEDERPSTQTQTRKQSQWGKVRWPTRPLLLSHMGSLLVKSVLLARTEEEAVYTTRLLLLARVVQTLLWFILTKDSDHSSCMVDEASNHDEHISYFVSSFFSDSTTREGAADALDSLVKEIVPTLSDAYSISRLDTSSKMQLLNVVACEVAPMTRIATFLLQRCHPCIGKRTRSPVDFIVRMNPVAISANETKRIGLLPLDQLSQSSVLPLLRRWTVRFKSAYDEMSDPSGVLGQWLTNTNAERNMSLTFASVLHRDLHTAQVGLSMVLSATERTRYLRSLPRPYVKFYADLAKRKCEACGQFPSRPAVCLLCGQLLCAANTCPSVQQDKTYPEESNPGACTVHARKCGRGSGLFLLVLEGAVLLVYWKLAAYVGSLYVDEYGEEFGERNRELNKGRPLYLHEDRRRQLLRLWRRHGIPNEVVKIQNSSERVIRNSHY